MIKLLRKKGQSLIVLLIILLAIAACRKEEPLPDPLQAGWNNMPVCEVLEETSYVRALKCTFPPGTGHERHYHSAHFGYALVGSTFRIVDSTGVREVNVPTGSSYSNDGIEWHEILNIGDSTAVFLIVESK